MVALTEVRAGTTAKMTRKTKASGQRFAGERLGWMRRRSVQGDDGEATSSRRTPSLKRMVMGRCRSLPRAAGMSRMPMMRGGLDSSSSGP